MSYCINPQCQEPQNTRYHNTCESCGADLLLKNRYRIIKPLGESWQKRTFLAIDIDQPSHPRVVIKQFIGPLSNHISSQSIVLEKLGKNSQLPSLLASFRLDEYFYLVQEFVTGHSLASDLKSGREFDEEQIWQLLEEMLPVLDCIHQKNVLHGDIKPENIIRHFDQEKKAPIWSLVDLDNQPYEVTHDKLLEKSRSKQLNSSDHKHSKKKSNHHKQIKPIKVPQYQPLTTELQGSPEYAAPEQIVGEAMPSSDLYSLGVICIHALTQMSPFDLYEIQSEEWVWQDYLRSPVSEELQELLNKLIAKNYEYRYQSASEAIADIEAKHNENTISPWKHWAMTLGAGVALALLSVGLNIDFSRYHSPSITFRYPHTPVPDRLPAFVPLNPVGVSPLRTLVTKDSPVWSIAVTPNGQILVTARSNGEIELIDKQTGSVLNTLIGHAGVVRAIAISPDGEKIVSAGEDQTVKVWQLSTGALLHTLRGHQGDVLNVAISPDGRAIASVAMDGTTKLWNLSTGALLTTLHNNQRALQTVAFSPNGEILATGGDDHQVKLWQWQNSQLLATLKGHNESVWSVAFSPDGQYLASGSWDHTIKIWAIGDPNFSGSALPARTLIGHTDKINSLVFNRDGSMLASADFTGTIKLWDMATGNLTGTLKSHNSWVKLFFDPVNQTLLSGSLDYAVKEWQLPTEEYYRQFN
ncbi:MAG: protein kinase domain-containing protein [Microcoleaceae cyanobacterium]